MKKERTENLDIERKDIGGSKLIILTKESSKVVFFQEKNLK
jgi:hypothetical protein